MNNNESMNQQINVNTKSIKDGKLLYHLTPIKNVESILRNDLKPRSELDKKFTDTANSDIIEKREQMKLTSYIPFHFMANGPYDGRARKTHCDEDFAYICVSRETVKNDCKIIVRHPLNNLNPNDTNSDTKNLYKLYDWDDGFSKIDWELMDKKDYKDKPCKQMCMSEALYSGTIKHENIQSIWIPTTQVDKFKKIKKEINGTFYINGKDFLIAENKKKKKNE